MKALVALVVLASTASAAPLSNVIYLERCKGGCTVQGDAVDDATTLRSTIPPPGPHAITEFQNAAGQRGTAADAEWAAILDCVRQVYSPYDVVVTDEKPATGTYHAAIVAGFPGQIGYGDNTLGVALIASDCSPQDNEVSFSFANQHGPIDRVDNICWTVTQEVSHAYGLDHTFRYFDGDSTCNDPTSYQTDCGGRKFFHNHSAICGEYGARPCKCGGHQNSHKRLRELFGEGTLRFDSPKTHLTMTTLGGPIIGAASSPHGVSKVQLLVNGAPWAEQRGVPFGPRGQPEGTYEFDIPAEVPDGVVAFALRAYDDLGRFDDSGLFEYTKGEPCTTADTCAPFQRCELGRCLWDEAAGELGDTCEYPQFCKSNLCRGSTETQICTIECDPEGDDCPSGYACASAGSTHVCFFDEGGGCCSSSDAAPSWAHLVMCALVLAQLLHRAKSLLTVRSDL